MTAIFLKLLNMSIAASWLVFAVVLIRLLLKKAPKWISCLLWGIVGLRLLVPVTLESAFSLIPSAEVIPQNITTTQTPAIYSGIPEVNNAVNPLFTANPTQTENVLEKLLPAASGLWLAGVIVLLAWGAVSYWKLRRQTEASVVYSKNVYACDDVSSPFILGVFFPNIYIPSGMDDGQLRYILAHEAAHIKRRDHWWKPLGFLLLAVYWFNPLLWVAYTLLCRDIERACDEKVIAGMDSNGKKGYSETLVACSVHRRIIMVCPVAFGEVGVKERVTGILHYKKPGFWLVLASVVVCMVTAVCFLTNPRTCVHTYQSEVMLASTCTSRGIEKRTCDQCLHMYTAYVDVCAHTAGEPFFVKEPSCTEQGERSATCTECAAVFLVEVLATNDVHDLQETVLQESTCTQAGEGIRTCTRCDHSERVVYEPTGHDYYVAEMEVTPTCTREGSNRKECTVCGDKIWVMIPKLEEHTWVEDTYGNYYCTSCHDVRLGRRDTEWAAQFNDMNEFTGHLGEFPFVGFRLP